MSERESNIERALQNSREFSLRWFWISLIITPVALLGGMSALSGSYFIVKGLFPYLILLYIFFEEAGDMPILLLLAVIQFPAYGIALSVAQYRGQTRRFVPVILALHLSAAVIAWFCVKHHPN